MAAVQHSFGLLVFTAAVMLLASSRISPAQAACAFTEGILLPRDPAATDCVVTIRNQQACRTINDILIAYNDEVPPGECVHLFFQPGEYFITSAPVVVSYSIEMSALGAGVSFSCDLNGTLNETSRQASESRTPIEFRRGLEETNVTMSGLDFHDCHALDFNEIDILTISNCSFRNFVTSAVDIFNCGQVTVQQCNFTDCEASLGKAQYRANSGGLSIAYNTNSSTHTHLPSITISGCLFRNNSAVLPQQTSTEQINLALNNQVYFARGGGCGIFLNEFLVNISVVIEDSIFLDNFAQSFGGGLYLYLDGNGTQHDFVIRRCNFTGNYAPEGNFSVGGGLQIALLLRNSDLTPSTFTFYDCYFERNSADFGGGISTVQTYSQGAGNIVKVTNSTFIRNRGYQVGSAVMFGSLLYVQNRVESYHYLTRDCTFLENTSPGGTFATGFIHVNFTGTNIISNNTGPGLRIFGSLVTVDGTLRLLGNNAQNFEGGALYIQGFGQIKLYDGAEVDFGDNKGRIGSAIVVDVQRSSSVLSELIFNSQCFLLNSESTEAPSDWNTSVVYFHGNTASVGPAVFISHLRHCSWYSMQQLNSTTNLITANFSIQNFTIWPVFNYDSDSNTATSQAEDPSGKQFYFQTEATHLVSDYDISEPITMWPGEERGLNLNGIDQFGNPTYIIIRLSDRRANINPGAFSQATANNINDTESDNDAVRFQPSLIPVQPNDEAIKLSYGFPMEVDPQAIHTGETFTVVVDSPLNVRNADRFNFTVQFADCLPGFVLRQRIAGGNLHVCVCDSTSSKVLDCESDVIVLREGHWAGPEPEPVPHLDLSPCPPSYCRCYQRDNTTCEALFFQDDPNFDLQCHPPRRGTLCGECSNGTGVGVLRTNCRQCNRENYWALGFLVVGDIILVSLILFSAVRWHFSFPHALKGLLFYIQSVYYVTAYFPSSFWDIRKYMLFISSALGLYFPWDFCLYPEMPALVSFAPRFVPVTIAVIITSVVLVAMVIRRSDAVAIARARATRKHIWRGMWSLVLLLYTPLAFTAASLLHCPDLPSVEDSDEAYRWFLAAQVKCFRDPGHIVLGLVAIFVISVLILMVPAVFLFTILGKTKKVQSHSLSVEYLYLSLTDGYQEVARWWGGWELARRLLLIMLVVALPGRSVFPLFIIVPAFGLHVFALPYKRWWENAIEAGVLANYILLLLIRATQPFLDSLSSYSGTEIPASRGEELAALDRVTWLLFAFYYFPVFCGIALCIAALGYHCIRFLRPRCLQKKRQLNTQGDFNDYSPAWSLHAHRHSSFAITSEYHVFNNDSATVDREKVTVTELELEDDAIPVYES